MLAELRAVGLGSIDEACVALGPGLNVVTGETGAGKSLLVGALSLLAGARADLGVVTAGRDTAEAEGRFVLSGEDAARVRAVLEDAGIPGEEDLVLARRVAAGGSRAYVNGRLATAGLLAALGGELLEITGQVSARSLLQPATQQDALDRFGGEATAAALRRVRALHGKLTGVRREQRALGGDPRERAREIDLLAHQVREIEATGARPGEDDDVAAEAARLADAERLRTEAVAVRDALARARDLAAEAAARLERSGDPDLGALGGAVAGVVAEIDDTGGDVRRFAEGCVADPERLAALEERRGALAELKRKYGPRLADVAAFAEEARRRLEELRGAEENLALLTAAAEIAAADLAVAAAELGAARRKAVPGAAAGITTRLRELALAGARFVIDVEDAPVVGPAGRDVVTFRFSAGAHEPLPLARTASGGELSRVLLAIAAEVGELEVPPTMVFDEIDAGIGGEAGSAVGRTLARLAAGRQVLCVTHLAQVACFADRHIGLTKEPRGGTRAGVLDGFERVVELSRMLSGSPDSARAQEHAAELLRSARGGRRRPRPTRKAATA